MDEQTKEAVKDEATVASENWMRSRSTSEAEPGTRVKKNRRPMHRLKSYEGLLATNALMLAVLAVGWSFFIQPASRAEGLHPREWPLLVNSSDQGGDATSSRDSSGRT